MRRTGASGGVDGRPRRMSKDGIGGAAADSAPVPRVKPGGHAGRSEGETSPSKKLFKKWSTSI